MIAEYQEALFTHGAWFYRRLFWETGLIGQVLYLEAEAAGVRATGIGCFFDDPVHRVFGIEDLAFQSLYHFTVGGPVDDPRLTTLAPYGATGPSASPANSSSALRKFRRAPEQRHTAQEKAPQHTRNASPPRHRRGRNILTMSDIATRLGTTTTGQLLVRSGIEIERLLNAMVRDSAPVTGKLPDLMFLSRVLHFTLGRSRW